MTLMQIVEWLSENIPEIDDCCTVGTIDGKREKAVGVYSRKPSGRQRMCIGGPEQTRYQIKAVTILVHWTISVGKAEAKAQEIYDALYGLRDCWMGGTRVISADPGAGVVPAGKDSKGIAEYIVNMDFVHEKRYDERPHEYLTTKTNSGLTSHTHKTLHDGGV